MRFFLSKLGPTKIARALRLALIVGISFTLLAAALETPRTALAWDSFGGAVSSHHDISKDALEELLADPALPDQLKDNLGWGKDTIIGYSGSEGEIIHGQKKQIVEGPNCYLNRAVGCNPGTTHPELWWQSAVAWYREWQNTSRTDRTACRTCAYKDLGRVVHAIEDMGSPPHAWYSMHGLHVPTNMFGANFELVSFLTSDDYDPDFYLHPGKNILDVDDHGDLDFFEFRLDPNVNDWRYTGLTTNLQTPAATKIMVSLCLISPFGRPDQVYLRVTYDNISGSQVSKEIGPLSPRCPPTPFPILMPVAIIDDDFAPNGRLSIDFKRLEEGDWWTAQIGVYVLSTKDIFYGLQRPSLKNPWEYYDWMRMWTMWNTAAPYWRRYWTLGGYGGMRYGVFIQPNTESALLTLQWAASKLVTRWFLEEAQAKLDDPNYTVQQAAGTGVRVVLYDDYDYNSGESDYGPEYIRSQAIVYEPDSNYGTFGTLLDGNFYLKRQGDFVTIESADLGFMASRVSSIEVRGAKVVLFDETNFNGYSRVIKSDTPFLGVSGIDFNDKTKSIRIELPHPPKVEAGINAVVDEGSAFDGYYLFVDPYSIDWDGSIDYGDGYHESRSWSRQNAPYHMSHIYADNGVYLANVTVTDDDGWTGSDSLTVTVLNVAPAITSLHVTSLTNVATLSGTFTDPGILDTHTVAIDWGDSSTDSLSLGQNVLVFTGSHPYSLPGTYAINVVVTDKDGGSSAGSTSIHIGAKDVNQAIMNDIEALCSATADKPDANMLGQAATHLDIALDPASWDDSDHLQPRKGNRVFNEMKDAINKLEIIVNNVDSSLSKAMLNALMDRLARIGRYIALTAINEASSINVKSVARANEQLFQGDSDLLIGRYVNAIEHYRVAWGQVTNSAP